MPTVTLRVKGDSLQKLYELLDQLPEVEVEVIDSDMDFQAAKVYLNEALQNLLVGNNRLVSQEELECNIDKVLSRHEN